MKKPLQGQGIEAIAVKRATVADADKVRYRVYRAPDDFVAVIAESALLAMRASGIENPYRIVRDLPSEGIAIEARRMEKEPETPIMVNLATDNKKASAGIQRQTEMKAPVAKNAHHANFVPMQVKDFQHKPTGWARVLTPDMVQAIAASRPEAKTPAPPPEKPPEPVPEPQAAAPETSDTLTEEEVQALLKG